MLTVETGDGFPDADSFFSLGEADIFLSARGFAAWDDAMVAQQEQAARQAADYLGLAWRWRGTPVNAAQRLCWPRAGVVRTSGVAVPSNTVPREVKEAAMLLAAAALSASLIAPSRPPEQVIVREEKELAGVGSQKLEYAVGEAAAGSAPKYPEVSAMLSDLASPGAALGGRGGMVGFQTRRA